MRKRSSTLLRERLAEPGILVKPGAFNAMSARIIEDAGFKVMGVSGYSVSASLLGKPDVGLITLDEIVSVTRYITSATSVPLLADADTGYGNAINAMRTTEEFIRAGAAGIHIEDQVAPKRCGHVAGKQIVPMEEAVGKIAACVKVRDDMDPDFLIIARTDARGVDGGGIDEVIRRANAYVEAGADMIFPDALISEEEVARACREVNAPIHFNRTGVSPFMSKDRLEELGVAIVSNASGALRAAARAMWDYMEQFAAEDVDFVLRFLDEGKDHPTGNMHEFVGFPEIRELEETYLPKEDVLARYENSLGYKP
jgi:2-methylisocitrate lyase-like PEP mutase family enzyme